MWREREKAGVALDMTLAIVAFLQSHARLIWVTSNCFTLAVSSLGKIDLMWSGRETEKKAGVALDMTLVNVAFLKRHARLTRGRSPGVVCDVS